MPASNPIATNHYLLLISLRHLLYQHNSGVSNLVKIALKCNFSPWELTTSIHFEHTRNLLQRQLGQLCLVLGSAVTGTGIYEVTLRFAEFHRSDASQFELFQGDIHVLLGDVFIEIGR